MIPENELGVIVLFAQQAKEAGFEITYIQSEFPDALVRQNDQEYRTEFEFCSANFRAHGHDIRQCDLIICWKHDLDNCALPVIELSNLDWKHIEIQMPSILEREAAYWKERALSTERQLRDTKARLDQVALDKIPLDLDVVTVRRERLRAFLSENGDHKQKELAGIFGISLTTLKRDLKAIEKDNDTNPG